MKIYNDSIENAVGVNSTFFGQYIGSAYSYITPPLNGLIIQGNVGIGTTAPTQNLHIQGALRLTGALYDSSNSLGVANQVLSSTGTGVAWTSISASGGSISGSGTVNFVPKFNTTSSLTNSNISDTGSLITLGVAVSANNQISINVPLGGTSIINTVNGSGLILQGRGTVGDPAALRIVGNDATIYADAVDTAYFQADYKNLRNLVLLSGTYGNDLPLNRLLLNTRQVTIWDGSHTSAPVPTSLFEVANGFAATKVNFKIIGTSAQTADFFQVYSSTLARNIFVIDASGNVGIGTTAPSQALHIQNNLRLTGRLFDTNNLSGTSNQLLASTGSAVTWVNGMIGSITANQVAFANANNVLTGVSTFVLTSTGLGINTTAPLSNLNVWAGSGTTTVFRVDSNSGLLFQITNSLTGTLFAVNNISGLSNFFVTDGVQNPLVNVNAPVGISSQIISVTSASNAPFFSITGLGSVGIATSSPTQNLHIQGNARLTGSLFDSNNAAGTSGQLLSSTGTGISWTTVSATGILTGSGTNNTVPKFSGTNSLTNSNITDSGTQIVLGTNASISGFVTSLGFFGPGTNITNLNASNLVFGTVPGAVVSGTYSGITSVGTLTQLNVSGITTSNIFVGNGSNITNLNAVNVTSGILAEARLNGSYSGITSVGTLGQLNVSGITTSTTFVGNGSNLINLNAVNISSGTLASTRLSGSYSGITSVGTLTQLNVSGITTSINLRLSGSFLDSNASSGTNGQLLSSTVTGVSWTSISNTGIITGSGVINAVAKFNSASSITTSNITDNGLAVTISSRLNVIGIGSFSNDLVVNNMTVGLGSAQLSNNVAIGPNALANNPSASSQIVAIGDRALQNASGAFFGVVAIGQQALQNNQGSRNFGLGVQALRSNTTGASNVAIGHIAMDLNQTGSQNVAIGRGALQNNVSSSSNTAIGDSVMNLATSDENTAIGVSAMNSLTSGRANQAFGAYALRYITTVSNLTAIGYLALAGSATTTLNTGTQNTAVGYQAGTATTSGSNNLFVGFQAGLANTSGSRNVFIGRTSGNANLTGSDNTLIGDATSNSVGASYQIAVGSAVVPTGANLGGWGGNTNATRTNLGVGTFTPLARMHVETLNAANAGLIVAGAASQTANLLEVDLTTNGVTAMVVTGVGSVGVNTATAAYPLHVVGAARVSNLGIGVAPQTSSILDVAGNINMSPGGAYRWGNGDAQISNNSGQYNIVLANYNGTFSQENMRLVSSGLVGIGTNSPATKLHVRSGFTTNTAFRISGLTGQTADLLQIESAIAGTTFVTVGAAGSVGIGTTAPSQPLHVQGTARFNGSILDNNNLPGAAIGIVSQVLTSTGVGVTWAPIKRNLVVPLMTAFNPTLVGIDSAVFIVPQDPINSTSSMTFNFRRVNVRVETPSAAGITTINIAKSISAGAFLGTNILTTSINLTGASTYEGFSTSFAAGFTTAASGDKLAINFVGVNTFHQNLTVELIAIEA